MELSIINGPMKPIPEESIMIKNPEEPFSGEFSQDLKRMLTPAIIATAALIMTVGWFTIELFKWFITDVIAPMF